MFCGELPKGVRGLAEVEKLVIAAVFLNFSRQKYLAHSERDEYHVPPAASASFRRLQYFSDGGSTQFLWVTFYFAFHYDILHPIRHACYGELILLLPWKTIGDGKGGALKVVAVDYEDLDFYECTVHDDEKR